MAAPPSVLDTLASFFGFGSNRAPETHLAESRIGHGPMLIVPDVDAFQKAVGDVFGISTRPGTADVNPRSPLAPEINRLQRQSGKQVIVLPGYAADSLSAMEFPKSSFAGTAKHEGVHQYIDKDALPAAASYMPDSIKAKIRRALPASSYNDAVLESEIPARLASGRYDTLGISKPEAAALWNNWLTAYGAAYPMKASVLKRRTSATAPQPEPEGE